MTTIWMKRLAVGAMLTAAPALFAIGAAGVGNAATSSTVDNGPHLSEPAHHESFRTRISSREFPVPRAVTTGDITTLGDRHPKNVGRRG